MTLEEFEDEVRQAIERILNHLQAANLLAPRSVNEAQAEILRTGRLVEELSYTIEDFIEQQRTR